MSKIPAPDPMPEQKPTIKEVIGYGGIYQLLAIAQHEPGQRQKAIAEINGEPFVLEFEATTESSSGNYRADF